MLIEKNIALQSLNSFGIAAKAHSMLRIHSLNDLIEISKLLQIQQKQILSPQQRIAPPPNFLVLGGGSNIVLTADVQKLLLKIEIKGFRVIAETADSWIIEAGAGERWHDLVCWSLEQGMGGLENMALIPGTVGAAPVQNIGAYGVELQDRFHALVAVDMWTGEQLTLNAEQCAFGYRESIFKHQPKVPPMDFTEQVKLPLLTEGLAGRAVVSHVHLCLRKKWRPVLDYLDLQRRMRETGVDQPKARQIFDWVVDIRRQKLPDPEVIGNVGSFFKNPSVTLAQCNDILSREPNVVHYPMLDGSIKLAAGWLIDACGWRGKHIGQAGVYEKQALVLINRGKGVTAATGEDVITLAKAIQSSVYKRFGIKLEPEPIIF